MEKYPNVRATQVPDENGKQFWFVSDMRMNDFCAWPGAGPHIFHATFSGIFTICSVLFSSHVHVPRKCVTIPSDFMYVWAATTVSPLQHKLHLYYLIGWNIRWLPRVAQFDSGFKQPWRRSYVIIIFWRGRWPSKRFLVIHKNLYIWNSLNAMKLIMVLSIPPITNTFTFRMVSWSPLTSLLMNECMKTFTAVGCRIRGIGLHMCWVRPIFFALYIQDYCQGTSPWDPMLWFI